MGRVIRIGLMLVGGLVVLIVALLLLAAVIFGLRGGGSGTQPQGGDQQQAKEQSGADYVKLSGTAGSASCAVAENGSSRSVDTRVPGEIRLDAGFGSLISVTCQKTGRKGSLQVDIFIDGLKEASSRTTAAYGAVVVGYPE